MTRSVLRPVVAALAATLAMVGLTAVPAVAAPATLTVTVTDSVTQVTLPGSCVTATRVSDWSVADRECSPPAGGAGPQGQVTLALDDASDYVLYGETGGDYLSAYYVTTDPNTPAHVRPPASVVLALAKGARPSGRLTLPGGAPASGYNVFIESTDHHTNEYAVTSTDGSWQSPLVPPGDYTVEFRTWDSEESSWAYGQRSAASASVIHVTLGSPTMVNDTFIPAPKGTVTGVVLDAVTKAPVSGVCVTWFNAADPVSYFHAPADGCTDASGRYRLNGVRAGQVILQFTDPTKAYPVSFTGGVYLQTRAKPVTVIDGGSVAAPTMRLRKGAVVTGSVRTPDGSPAVGACVTARLGRTAVDVTLAEQVCTDANGEYAVAGLPSRAVTIGFDAGQRPNDRRDTVRTWAPGVEKQKDARVVTLTAGQTLALGVTTLLVGGSVTGRVVDGAGQPIAGILVNLDGWGPSPAGPGEDPYETTTNDHGEFTILGVPSGTYSPIAYDLRGKYGTSLLGSKPGSPQARKIQVALGKAVSIGFTLDVAATLHATITKSGAVTDGLVMVYATGRSSAPISSGVFGYIGTKDFPGLAPGTYKVGLIIDGPFNGPPQYWYGGTDFASATTVTVTASGASIVWNIP